MRRAVKIISDDGTETLYPLRLPEELTVSEWVRMAIPPLQSASTVIEELENTYELCQRYIGVPRDVLRKIPFSSLRDMMECVEKAALAAKASREDTSPITFLEHGGERWVVPMNPGEDLTTGQYADIMARLEKLDHEDQAIALILAVMLHREGEAYSGSRLDERVKLFSTAPAMKAIRIVSGFFVGSEDLSELWSRYMSNRLTSRLQYAQAELTALLSGGASTLPSPEPQP